MNVVFLCKRYICPLYHLFIALHSSHLNTKLIIHAIYIFDLSHLDLETIYCIEARVDAITREIEHHQTDCQIVSTEFGLMIS